MNILDIMMKLDGQVFFEGGEMAEAVSEDHSLSSPVFSGEVLLL